MLSPANDGGTNWWPPSFSPQSGLFYVTARDATETYFAPGDIRFDSMKDLDRLLILLKEPDRMARLIETLAPKIHDDARHELRAIEPLTGEIRWRWALPGRSTSGVLSTAGRLVFTGSTESDVWALDAATGQRVWHHKIGGWIHAGPITYTVDGRQRVTVVSSTGVYTFGLE